MTNGCLFGDGEITRGAGEHAILTPSPTGAGPLAFGHLTAPRHTHPAGVQKERPNHLGSATAPLHRHRPFTGLRKYMVQTLLPCPGTGTHTPQQAS